MKKKFICLVAFVSIFATGCKKDSMDGITIYTTTYPIEYITNALYGENSEIYSIYPNEVIEPSEKLLNDYSSADMFVYNGLSVEQNYAVKMLNNNKYLIPVDAASGIVPENIDGIEELWLNPSNFLMLCLNIKNNMKRNIDNGVLKKQIDTNYDKLNLEISELDAEIKLLIENADDINLLVSNDALKFLEKKYNDPNKNKKINVVSLENNDNLTNDVMNEAKKLINDKKIKYIIMFRDDVLTDDVEKLITDNNIEKVYFDPLTTLSSENKASGKDYISIMNENLNILRQELYEEEK